MVTGLIAEASLFVLLCNGLKMFRRIGESKA